MCSSFRHVGLCALLSGTLDCLLFFQAHWTVRTTPHAGLRQRGGQRAAAEAKAAGGHRACCRSSHVLVRDCPRCRACSPCVEAEQRRARAVILACRTCMALVVIVCMASSVVIVCPCMLVMLHVAPGSPGLFAPVRVTHDQKQACPALFRPFTAQALGCMLCCQVWPAPFIPAQCV